MLDLKQILNKPDFFKEKLAQKKVNPEVVDEIINLGQKRSEFMTKLQTLESKRNTLSKEIGILKGKGENADSVLAEVSKLKDEVMKAKELEQEVVSKINDKLLYIPNITLEDVPAGNDENDNKIILKQDQIGRGLVKDVKPHFEIATELDIVDFERAVKLSGARFWSYKGHGAKLVRALENYMLDKHVANGYVEWRPPVIVKDEILRGTGQLPKFADDLFKIEDRNAYLIPTAEVPLTNLHNNEIIDLAKPISYTAFTPCFRAEAGSGGKDMKGLIRAHQFNKVELVKFTSKEQVEKEFENMVAGAKGILEDLKLPYQELLLCTGDTGFSSQKTIDLEVWIPSESKFREISSISTMGDFQGRRASIRYKNDEGDSQYVYTMNGSALAIDRTVAAILENYQNDDGSISIPDVLKPYMNNLEKIS